MNKLSLSDLERRAMAAINDTNGQACWYDAETALRLIQLAKIARKFSVADWTSRETIGPESKQLDRLAYDALMELHDELSGFED